MSLISVDLIAELVRVNEEVLDGKLVHPSRLAIKLEEMAELAWLEAKDLGLTTFEEAEGLQPCIRIDP